MINLKVIVVLVLLLNASQTLAKLEPNGEAEWTILIYMNGDNNLEPNALLNFVQLAKVGSTEKVRFIVQMDRIGKYVQQPNWSQTLRFYMQKGIKPLPSNALEDLGELNMGSETVLDEFVYWGIKQYPARHYMLVIWDHGQGWRNLPPRDTSRRNRSKQIGGNQFSGGAPYRSASNDETDGDDVLYNKELHDAIQKAMGGKKLDVIGFDTCLMAMVETAYAVNDVASYMVASEELEPGSGWNYEDWARRIHMNIPSNGKELVALTVRSYEAEYRKKDPTTTLSAFDLSHTTALAESINNLSLRLKEQLRRDVSVIANARRAVSRYAPEFMFNHIDLGKFLDELASRAGHSDLISEIQKARNLLRVAIVANYAGAKRRSSFGSTGMAIYFPGTLEEYKADPFSEAGYEKDNDHFPVAFVREIGWTDFLHSFWEQLE